MSENACSACALLERQLDVVRRERDREYDWKAEWKVRAEQAEINRKAEAMEFAKSILPLSDRLTEMRGQMDKLNAQISNLEREKKELVAKLTAIDARNKASAAEASKQ